MSTADLAPTADCHTAAEDSLGGYVQAVQGIRAGVRLAGGDREPWFRSFSDLPRERAEAGVFVEANPGHWSGRLQVGVVDAGRDQPVARFDGSYLAAQPGNWVLGAGAVDRWWGPGWYSSLALSSNARPVPGVWLARQQSRPSGLPLLRIFGPWQLSLFAGQLESERDVPEAKLLGARLAFRPFPQLDIGLTRLAQWGGEGRPENAASFWHLIIGRDNGATSGLAEDEDPGNQLGGLDFRAGFALGENSGGIYGQIMGDDEAGGLPAKYTGLAGVDLATHLLGSSQRWVLEATNTVAGGWFGDERLLTTYEHGTYTSGFRYYGRALASTWERDAEVMTVGFHQFFTGGSDFWLRYSSAELNNAGRLRAATVEPGAPLIALPSMQETSVWAAGWGFSALGGRVTLAATYFDPGLVTTEGALGSSLWSASWEHDFEL